MALITSGGLKEVILQFEMKTTSDEILEAVWVKVCKTNGAKTYASFAQTFLNREYGWVMRE